MAKEEATKTMIQMRDVVRPAVEIFTRQIGRVHAMIAALDAGDLKTFLLENIRSEADMQSATKIAQHLASLGNTIKFSDPETFDDALFESKVEQIKIGCAQQSVEWLREQLAKHEVECTSNSKECSSSVALRQMIASREALETGGN